MNPIQLNPHQSIWIYFVKLVKIQPLNTSKIFKNTLLSVNLHRKKDPPVLFSE